MEYAFPTCYTNYVPAQRKTQSSFYLLSTIFFQPLTPKMSWQFIFFFSFSSLKEHNVLIDNHLTFKIMIYFTMCPGASLQ